MLVAFQMFAGAPVAAGPAPRRPVAGVPAGGDRGAAPGRPRWTRRPSSTALQPERAGARSASAGRIEIDSVSFPLSRRAGPCATENFSLTHRARAPASRSPAPRAAARARSPSCCRASTCPAQARCASTDATRASSAGQRAARSTSASCRRRRASSRARCFENLIAAQPHAESGGGDRGLPPAPRSTTSSRACRRATSTRDRRERRRPLRRAEAAHRDRARAAAPRRRS